MGTTDYLGVIVIAVAALITAYIVLGILFIVQDVLTIFIECIWGKKWVQNR